MRSKNKDAHRKYDEDFLKFGFTSTMENDIVVPESLVYCCKLASSAMVPSKLQCQLLTNLPSLAVKDKSCFQKSVSAKFKEVNVFEIQLGASEEAQIASYKKAALIAIN